MPRKRKKIPLYVLENVQEIEGIVELLKGALGPELSKTSPGYFMLLHAVLNLCDNLRLHKRPKGISHTLGFWNKRDAAFNLPENARLHRRHKEMRKLLASWKTEA